MESQRLWQTVLGELELTLNSAHFKTWFGSTGIISYEDGQVVVAVPNMVTKTRMEKLYADGINDSLKRAGAMVKSIEYKIATPPNMPVIAKKAPVRTDIVAPQKPVQTAARLTSSVPTMLNGQYTFDNFVVGDSNEMAYASAKAVASYPGEKYRCLFIYGGVGLGKTHLIQAIGNQILERDPDARVRYISSEQFTREFTDSIQSKRTKRFSDLYRNLDVLIVDDIQFLGNKEKTQEEFFHTFNTLHQQNKQIILSSDRAPKAIPNLEDRLRSRFEWDMVADVQRPELETRIAIIRAKAGEKGLDLPLELTEFLARQFQHSVREVEGALTKLSMYCEHRDQDPSLSVMKGILGSSQATPAKRITSARSVIDKTAEYFDLTIDDLTGPRRDKDIVLPRQIAAYIMNQDLKLSLPKVGASLGGRDHTTIMHSVKKIDKALELDDELRSDINQIKERLSL